MPCTITAHPCYLLHFLLWNSQCEACCYVNYLTKAWVPDACSLKETSSPHLSSFMLKSGPFKVPLCDSYYFLYPYCNNNKKYFVNCNISHPQLCDFHMSSRLMLSLPPLENLIPSLCFTSYFALYSFFSFEYVITHHLLPLYCSFRGKVLLRGLHIFTITFFLDF